MHDPIRNLLIDGVQYTFLFRKVICQPHHKYFISAYNSIETQTSFEMKKNGDGRWKIAHPARDWILCQEETLSRVLDQNA